MEDKLNNFINTWTNIPNVGDTPENKGQCVGLIEVWIDALGLTHDWGNAKDLLADANTTDFDVIYNNPNDLTQCPIPGDIMVWGASWGGGYGHTGVIVTANGTSFTCFEQNNPEGHAPQINGHTNYNGVLGWLHPKVNLDTPPVLEGLAKDVGYNPTFEGQDVMVNGVHYKSIKVDNVLVWKIEESQPVPPVEPVVVQDTTGTSTPTTVVTIPPVVEISTPPPTVQIDNTTSKSPPIQAKFDLFSYISRIFNLIFNRGRRT